MKRVKRIAVCAVMILVCFLLETTIFDKLAIASVVPNLLIVIAASFGFMRGHKEGLIVGFCCGLLKDVMYGDFLGFYALLYMLIGYCNGYFKRLFYVEDVKLPMVLIAVSEFVYSIVVYICLFMLKSDFNFRFYFDNIIMPELVYTIFITLGLYQIILRINERLEEEEKRSASRFV